MGEYLREFLRRSENYKEELKSVAVGLILGYAVQVLIFFMIRFVDSGASAKYLIPNPEIIFVMAPIITWIFFALFRVKWMEKWTKITTYALFFIIPFLIISGVIEVLIKCFNTNS